MSEDEIVKKMQDAIRKKYLGIEEDDIPTILKDGSEIKIKYAED